MEIISKMIVYSIGFDQLLFKKKLSIFKMVQGSIT